MGRPASNWARWAAIWALSCGSPCVLGCLDELAVRRMGSRQNVQVGRGGGFTGAAFPSPAQGLRTVADPGVAGRGQEPGQLALEVGVARHHTQCLAKRGDRGSRRARPQQRPPVGLVCGNISGVQLQRLAQERRGLCRPPLTQDHVGQVAQRVR
jgi:hypothetical protein